MGEKRLARGQLDAGVRGDLCFGAWRGGVLAIPLAAGTLWHNPSLHPSTRLPQALDGFSSACEMVAFPPQDCCRASAEIAPSIVRDSWGFCPCQTLCPRLVEAFAASATLSFRDHPVGLRALHTSTPYENSIRAQTLRWTMLRVSCNQED